MRVRLKSPYSSVVYSTPRRKLFFARDEEGAREAPEGFDVFVGAADLDPALAHELIDLPYFELVLDEEESGSKKRR